MRVRRIYERQLSITMKTILLSSILSLGLAAAVWGQTSDDYVAWGRGFLAAHDMAAANASFAFAVSLNPANQTARALRAASRLLALPDQPPVSDFLTRLGFAEAGRNIYSWTSEPLRDRNGVPLVTPGLNGNEFPAMVRTNVLAAILASEVDLQSVSNVNFVLSLTAAETGSTDVTVDYGDIQMLRAMLAAAEYGLYTACAWDLNSQLDVIRSLYINDELSVGRVLADSPGLLTFATTNDLAAAKLAFQRGVDHYLFASTFIRERAGGVVRLFNFEPEMASDEEHFRQTLIELRNSFSNAVTLSLDTNITVFLGAQTAGTHALRSFLPWISGNAFGLNTLPDPTFGGLVQGISGEEVDEFLAEFLMPIPSLSAASRPMSGQFQFPINVSVGRGYQVQVSTNLMAWTNLAVFVAEAGAHLFVDTAAGNGPRRFYRVVDCSTNMPVPGNDSFSNRIQLNGWGAVARGYCGSGSLELGEPSSCGQTVWWSWTAPSSGRVVITTRGSPSSCYADIYTGNSLGTLIFAAYDGQPFNAVAGTTYQIQVHGYDLPGGVRLTITVPPAIVVYSPADGSAISSPANILLLANATDADGTASLSVFGDGQLLGSSAGGLLTAPGATRPPAAAGSDSSQRMTSASSPSPMLMSGSRRRMTTSRIGLLSAVVRPVSFTRTWALAENLQSLLTPDTRMAHRFGGPGPRRRAELLLSSPTSSTDTGMIMSRTGISIPGAGPSWRFTREPLFPASSWWPPTRLPIAVGRLRWVLPPWRGPTTRSPSTSATPVGAISTSTSGEWLRPMIISRTEPR
jgi:hypothetical protein